MKKLTRIQQKDKFLSCMKMEINILTNISKERNQTNERSINLKEYIYHHSVILVIRMLDIFYEFQQYMK